MDDQGGLIALANAGGVVGLAATVLVGLVFALKAVPLLIAKLGAAVGHARAEKDMIERLEARIDKAEARADLAEQRADRANAERNTVIREMGGMRETMAAMTAQLAAANEKSDRVSAQLQAANDTIRSLQAEVARLGEMLNGTS